MSIEVWDSPKSPSHLALPNLRKISSFMITEGYTSPIMTTSASRIAKSCGISINQIANLLNRPGFVKAASGWYYLPEFGFEYPAQYSPGLPMIKNHAPTKQIISVENVGTQKVAEQLLKPGEIIITPMTFDKTSTTYSKLTALFDGALTAVIKGERSPKQFAEFAHGISSGILDRTITITGENHD